MVANLAQLPPTEDLTSVIAEVQCLFRELGQYDPDFGNNDYCGSGPCRFDGWQHPTIRQYLANKGYRDRREMNPHELRSLHWNLTKLLTRYRDNACILPRREPTS